MKISERLKTISTYVLEDSITADIGTDHGYLLRFLLDEGRIKKGFACDLNKKPLTYAEKNLKKYINKNKAEIRLGNGLRALQVNDAVQCLVVAGMGGHLMTEILSDGEEILEKTERIILAPNIAWGKLREYVVSIGWKIVDEDLVLEDNKFYPIIVIEKGRNKKLSPGEVFFGPVLIKKKHPLLATFVECQKIKLDKNISRMRKGKSPDAEIKIDKILKNWEEMSRCLNDC